ncbi:unnamed protein product [Mytilus edulis]|uniref:B box-type domain-containing protein n=1 Tax=Mytilus edulis TaxID=6550 RepID=A0A8S3PZR0_MYTED|nr:unnamed protein product [Mytilus edulis]
MAYSNSLCKGQIPMLCQLCEDSNEIKWKCLQCDFLLCTKCQKIHNKVKSTDQHTIIDIKDIASQKQEAKVNTDFSALKEEKAARKHSREPVNTYVKGLHQSIPGKIGEAQCGQLIESDDYYAHEQYGAKVIEQYQTGLKLVEQLVCSDDGTLWIGNIADKILQKTQLSNGKLNIQLQFATSGMALALQGDLFFSIAGPYLKMLCHTTGKMIESKNSVAPLITGPIHITKQDKIPKLVNACDVFNAFKEEKEARKHSREPVNTYAKRLPQYIPGKLKIQEALHGELTEPDDDHAEEQFEAKVIEQYQTGIKFVDQLVCSDDGTLWIGNIADKILQKIQLSNGKLNIVQEVKINCAGMALLPSGDLLISTAESNLKILSHTTGIITNSKYSVEPLITGGVHLIRNEKIVIRARKEGPVFPVKGPRQVVLMDIDGRIEKVYDLDNNGKPIFFAPQRITTDTDDNIYVLDTFNTEWNATYSNV